MRSFTERQLREAIEATGVRQHELLVVHSALFPLGRLQGVAIQEIPSRLYRAIRSQVGPRGTIVVPTFNFDFCNGVEFDREHSPSKGMGAFSEYVRNLPDARRSPHPMQSVAAVGPLAKAITERDTAGAFSEGSSFDALLEYDSRILLVGCGIDAVSLIHWAEQKVGVPYRFWKEFSGAYRDGRWSGHKTYRMYARDLRRDPEVRLDRVARSLRRRGELRRIRLGAGAVEGCRARHFAAAAVQLLRRDPNALIRPPASDSSRRSHA